MVDVGLSYDPYTGTWAIGRSDQPSKPPVQKTAIQDSSSPGMSGAAAENTAVEDSEESEVVSQATPSDPVPTEQLYAMKI